MHINLSIHAMQGYKVTKQRGQARAAAQGANILIPYVTGSR